ncbi:MAG: O-antigen ligase family protein [Verrucomicrobiae bacterium]|nr:O-antigen ligase family protein [Verrucomicrobiae bacterium]
MTSKWRGMVLTVFLAGLVLAGVTGTSASMTFFWPACAVLGIAALLSLGLILQEAHYSLPRSCALAVLAFAACLLFRAATSPVAYFAREDASLIILAFVVYGLFHILLGTQVARRRLVETLAFLAVLNLAFAAIQATFRPTLWIIPGYERTFAERPGGLFNHPDHYAGFLAMLVPLWLANAFLGRRPRIERTAFGVLGAVSTLAVLGSGSTAAILALATGMAVFLGLLLLVVHRRIGAERKRTGTRLIAAAALALLLGAVFVHGPAGRFLDRTLLTKSGQLSLPLVWKSGLDQIAESPVTGTGSRTSYIFTRLFRNEALSSSTEPEFIHNEYLQMVADYGILGFLLLAGLLALHLSHGVRFVSAYADFDPPSGSLAPKSDHLALAIGALAALGTMAWLALFDFLLHLPVFVIVAALFLAALAVPDPMNVAAKPASSRRFLPGGPLVFANRALVFGFGLAVAVFGMVFSRSEYHYEMARRAFETDPSGFVHLRHLQEARSLDPKNPYLYTLSAHAQVAGILPEMPEPARREALEKADHYFSHARALYPQDVFAAIGHAAVLEELGRPSEALSRIREARKMAPLYGNLTLAEAELHLRNGRIDEAETVFAEATHSRVFRDTSAAQRGLRTITEWKLIAEQNGMDWRIAPDREESVPLLAGTYDNRIPAAAVIETRTLAGQESPANRNDPPVSPDPATTSPSSEPKDSSEIPTLTEEPQGAPAPSAIEPLLFIGPPFPTPPGLKESGVPDSPEPLPTKTSAVEPGTQPDSSAPLDLEIPAPKAFSDDFPPPPLDTGFITQGFEPLPEVELDTSVPGPIPFP